MQSISMQDLAALMAAQQAARPPPALISFKAGKMTKSGKLVTPVPRKGLCSIIQASDGTIHWQWKERTSNNVIDDFVVFNDAVLKNVPQCKTGKVILLEMTATHRQYFYWIQEPSVTDEQVATWIEKGNQCLSGNIPADLLPTPNGDHPAPGSPADQLMQMLGGNAPALLRGHPAVQAAVAAAAGAGGGPMGAGQGVGTSGEHAGASQPVVGEEFLREVLAGISGGPTPAACKPRAAAPPPAAAAEPAKPAAAEAPKPAAEAPKPTEEQPAAPAKPAAAPKPEEEEKKTPPASEQQPKPAEGPAPMEKEPEPEKKQ
ncbi:putative proteasomal ubiquitin receptor ADRM1 [Paratrimastix pyriformis]|uniref:Proteasomal ubiquitin receptor ADRM1 n=1 Tax=Paratrimastix pyriformis TaxID=342808 RepID=A0ABQ8U638_9EUKA|nr:putative proteasomal ubiquitin receptor ADRM1 [Paratrimastix pyriformis]